MNYYEARPLTDESGGGWHYTVRNGKNIVAVGYCATHPPHATKEEAEECYRKYLLDTRLHLNKHDRHTQRKCKECDEWTTGYAECEFTLIHLCDKHMTRETFDKHFPKVGEIISSW